jgi:hypothetical protein
LDPSLSLSDPLIEPVELAAILTGISAQTGQTYGLSGTDRQRRQRAQRATNRRRSEGRMTLRINGSDHGKHSDSEQQAEKHNLCSSVTEQANAGSRQIQRGRASEHSHREKKDRRR